MRTTSALFSLFLRWSSSSPLYLAVTSVLVLPEVYRFMDFWKTSSGIPYSVLLGTTVVIRSASVYEACWKNFTHFFVFDTKHTIYELCLPYECGFVCVWIWQTQSRAGSTVGRLCSQLQLRSPLWCRTQSLWSVVPSLPLQLS